MVADTAEVFKMWDSSLKKLVAIRQGLMSGLGNVSLRQTVWECQYWKLAGADREENHRLTFEDVERFCWKLSANMSPENPRDLFDVSFPSSSKHSTSLTFA